MVTETKNFYSSFAQPAMIALARAGNRGCRVDVELRKKYAEKAAEDAAKAIESLTKLVGREVNPNSPKQVKELLYDELKLPPQFSAPSGGFRGKVTCDEEAIKKLKRIAPEHSALLELLLDYRGHTKRKAMLEVELEERSDGESYFTTSYNATGTETGRISSSTTVLGKGGNLQNQERGETRRVFVPRKGKVFVKADASQAEARVVAALMGDGELVEKFNDPEFDIHAENATLCYGGTVEEVLREDALREEGKLKDSRRRRTKAVTHGANYKGGPRVAVKSADIPFAEARDAIERYRRSRPLLQRWWSQVEEKVKCREVIRTFWGRQRIFLGRADESTFRAAIAFEPQSTVGDLINHAFFQLDEAGDGEWWPLLQAHDEIVCEVERDRVTEVVDEMRRLFEWPLHIGPFSLVIPADIAVGENWYDMEGV